MANTSCSHDFVRSF